MQRYLRRSRGNSQHRSRKTNEIQSRSTNGEINKCATQLNFNNKCVSDLMTDFDQDKNILTVKDYAAFVSNLKHNLTRSNSTTDNYTFVELDFKMQLVYVEHLCEIFFIKGNLPQLDEAVQQNVYENMADCYIDLFQRAMANNTFGYPSETVAVQDMEDLCADMYGSVTLLGYLNPCGSAANSTSDCGDNNSGVLCQPTGPIQDYYPLGQDTYKGETFGLTPLLYPSPSPAASTSPTSASSQNSTLDFVASPVGIIVCVASGVAFLALVVGVSVVLRRRRKECPREPKPSNIFLNGQPLKTSARKGVGRISSKSYNDLSDLISEAERSLTVAELEALARYKKAHDSTM